MRTRGKKYRKKFQAAEKKEEVFHQYIDRQVTEKKK